MMVRLVPTDCRGPRPYGHLPWGVFAFCCSLCGEGVFLHPEHEKPKVEGCVAASFPVHPKCRELASPPLAASLTAVALAQRTWELRAQLN